MIGTPSHLLSVRSLFILATLVVIASGCRSYGGSGSEEAIYNEIQRAHQIFEEELVRARTDLSRLEQAASENERLADFSATYRQVVEGHEVVLEDQSEMIANLSPAFGHRPLHRVFGALITQRRTVMQRYERVLEEAHYSFLSAPSGDRLDRPYALIPPYYRRVQSAQRAVTLNDVLAAARRDGRQEMNGASPGLEAPDAANAALDSGGTLN